MASIAGVGGNKKWSATALSSCSRVMPSCCCNPLRVNAKLGVVNMFFYETLLTQIGQRLENAFNFEASPAPK